MGASGNENASERGDGLESAIQQRMMLLQQQTNQLQQQLKVQLQQQQCMTPQRQDFTMGQQRSAQSRLPVS